MEYRTNKRTGDRISVVGLGTSCISGELFYQIHFGANYETGEYGWSTDLDTVKRSVDWQLRELGTDYIDYGMIHCIDEASDWRAYQDGGVLDYLLDTKKQGVVRHIGLSSPFGRALTRYQCMQYALDKPGVLTVLPGARGVDDVKDLLGFLDASPEERDYSVLGSFTPSDAAGTCVYCNHCQPCPAELNVGLINKYYDLALAGDAMAADHYGKLEKKASDCVSCGHCDRRCPFHVAQGKRMEEIARYFG